MKTRSFVGTWVVGFVLASAVLLVGQASFAGLLPPETGLQLWLKADAGVVTDSNGVNTWQDQSSVNGSNDATQTRDAVKPQLSTISTPVNSSQSIVQFGGTSDLVFTLPGAHNFSGFSVFAVVTRSDTVSTQTVLGSDQNLGTVYPGARWGLGVGTDASFHHQGLGWAGTDANVGLGDGPTSTQAPASALLVASYVYDKTQWNVNVASGGQTLVSSTAADASFPTGDFSGVLGSEIDSDYWGVYSPLHGGIAEVLIYDHAVTGSELANVESYLNGRYVATPEPSSLALLATGLIGLLAYVWRKRR